MKRRTVLTAALPVLVAAALLIGGIVERERALGKLSHVARAPRSRSSRRRPGRPSVRWCFPAR
jgi:hypothetical protein